MDIEAEKEECKAENGEANNNSMDSAEAQDKAQAENDGTSAQSAPMPDGQSAGVAPDAQDGDSGENAAAGAGEVSNNSEKDALKAENASLRDQLLRLAADFDNYRKRMIKEKADAYDYALEGFCKDLLEGIDNLERTAQACEGTASEGVKAIADGVKMTRDGMLKMLGDKYALKAFGEAGEAFNPDKHQAIGTMAAAEGEDIKESTIKEVYQKGYTCKGRVIRHAKVMVITPK